MKSRSIAIALAALCLAGAAVCLAADTTLGTWKLNDAKSKIPAGAPKNTMVVYTMVGDSIKVTIDGLDGTGKPTHSEWTGKFDGKEYPVTGDTTSDTRSYKKNRRPHARGDVEDGRQSGAHGEDRGVGGWEDADGDGAFDGPVGEKVNERRGVRQAVDGEKDSEKRDSARERGVPFLLLGADTKRRGREEKKPQFPRLRSG